MNIIVIKSTSKCTGVHATLDSLFNCADCAELFKTL